MYLNKSRSNRPALVLLCKGDDEMKKSLAIIIAIITVLSVSFGVWMICEHNNKEIMTATPDEATVDEIQITTPDEATVAQTEEQTDPPTEAPTEPETDPPVVEYSSPEVNNGSYESSSTLTPSTSNDVFYLSDEERYIAECLVMGESGHNSYELQVLTAQCILNACLADGLQPSQVMSVYQYFGWNNNPTDSVKQAVSAVFSDGYRLTDEPILYFYAPHLCYSDWHESQRYVLTQDGIRFFTRW